LFKHLKHSAVKLTF